MPIRARTNNATLTVGTRLSIMEEPQGDGHKPRPFRVGDEIEYGRPNGPFRYKGTVTAVDPTGVEVKIVSTGDEFRMRRKRPGEYDSSILPGRMVAEEWVIERWISGAGNLPL